MKVYVSAKYEDASRAQEIMKQLVDAGHEITYDWTRHPEDISLAQEAQNDLDGVLVADAFVFIVEKEFVYRGAYVEFGAALARGIPCYLVGHAADGCIFTRIPQVRHGLDGLLKGGRI